MAPKGTLKTCKRDINSTKVVTVRLVLFVKRERKPKRQFLALISAPARRALERENIKTLEDLAKWTEREIISLHGMGPGTLPKLIKALKDNGLSFKS